MQKNLDGLNVAVIGLGLLGTSLAMAMRRLPVHRLGWTRRREVREWALTEKILEETAENPADILSRADLVILTLPIPVIIEFVRQHAAEFKPGSVVTDIGSVKEVIVNNCAPELKKYGVFFVGSHPMAGTEKSGPKAAFPTLYDNAEVFVTCDETTDEEAVKLVEAFWQAIGTTTVRIAPVPHDQLVAHSSHVSHLLALALTMAVLDCDDKKTLEGRFSGCATGFRDTSRIASSSPAMWREIIENNLPAVLDAMDSFEAYYKKLRAMLEAKDFDQFEAEFARGKALRDSWIRYKNEKHHCNW